MKRKCSELRAASNSCIVCHQETGFDCTLRRGGRNEGGKKQVLIVRCGEGEGGKKQVLIVRCGGVRGGGRGSEGKVKKNYLYKLKRKILYFFQNRSLENSERPAEDSAVDIGK